MSDHTGVAQKAALRKHLEAAGHQVLDLGTNDAQPVDYPDLAAKGARAVASGEAERGVFLCGTGLGVCMAANKVHGIRAATLSDDFTAEMSRRHNDANVACLGARIHADSAIARIVDVFLSTPFDGGRHAGRVAKIMAIEDLPSDPHGPD